MANALSHLHSEISGSIAGLTYQRSGRSFISLRSRTSHNQVKSAAAFAARGNFREASLTWRRFSPAQRQLILDWANLRLYPSLQTGSITMEAARLAWSSIYRLALKSGLILPTSILTACLPSLSIDDRSVYIRTWTSPAPGRITLTLSSPNAFSGRYYGRFAGPFDATVKYRPHGWKAYLSQWLPVVSGSTYLLNYNGYKSNRYYFVKVVGVASNAGGLVYLGQWNTRILVT